MGYRPRQYDSTHSNTICKSKKRSDTSKTNSIGYKKRKHNCNYDIIKVGVEKSHPIAIVLWAFHKIRSRKKGLSSRRIIGFIKERYQVANDPRKTGKAIGAMLRCAVDFGLLKRIQPRYLDYTAVPRLKVREQRDEEAEQLVIKSPSPPRAYLSVVQQ